MRDEAEFWCVGAGVARCVCRWLRGSRPPASPSCASASFRDGRATLPGPRRSSSPPTRRGRRGTVRGHRSGPYGTRSARRGPCARARRRVRPEARALEGGARARGIPRQLRPGVPCARVDGSRGRSALRAELVARRRARVRGVEGEGENRSPAGAGRVRLVPFRHQRRSFRANPGAVTVIPRAPRRTRPRIVRAN